VPKTSSMEVLPPEPLGGGQRPLSASTSLMPMRMSDPPPRMSTHPLSHSTTAGCALPAPQPCSAAGQTMVS
jgi:hypothetical protein